MKKVTRKNLENLMKDLGPGYAAMTPEKMRSVVGGYSTWEEWLNSGYFFYDNKESFMWFSSYDSYTSSYSSYMANGYVDHASPGYFYFKDGYGGWIQYYNSVYGYGSNEVIPTSALCAFEVLSKITGQSVETLFTKYKNLGYAYNPGIGGIYLNQMRKFIPMCGGTNIGINDIDEFALKNHKVMATIVTSYTSETQWVGHQVIINGIGSDSGGKYYKYIDVSNNNKEGKAYASKQTGLYYLKEDLIFRFNK